MKQIFKILPIDKGRRNMVEKGPGTEHLKDIQRMNEQLLFRAHPDVHQSETQRPSQVTETNRGKPYRAERFRYGIDGRVVARDDIASDGNVSGTENFDYNSSGDLQEKTDQNAKGKTIKTTRYQYNPDGRLIEKVYLSGDTREPLGQMADLYRYEGNSIVGNVIIQSHRKTDGTVEDTERFIFTDGNMSRWELLDRDGKVAEWWDLICDDHGRMSSETHRIAKNGFKATVEYERDAIGNVIKIIHLNEDGKETHRYDVQVEYESK